MNHSAISASPNFGAARQIWALILVCTAIDPLMKLVVGIKFQMHDIAAVIALTLFGLGMSALYTFKRPDERIARMFRGAVELFLITFLVGSLSYSATSLDLPMWDATFQAWDHVLAFDWKHWLTVLDGHPRINLVLVLAYHSMWPQLTLVLIALITIRDFRRLDVFLVAFALGAIITVVVAGLMPAMGPRAWLGITPADHPNITLAVSPEFEMQAAALRSGAMKIIDAGNAQGLVTFPSFHTVTAMLLLLGFRSVPYLRWASLILNGIMLIAIPIEGSHYLVDVIAGIAVALSAWAAANAIVNATARSRIAPQPESLSPAM